MWFLFFYNILIRFGKINKTGVMIIEKQEADYTMVDWWKKAFLKNYANFEGRARRKEYWYFTLLNVLIMFPTIFVLAFLSESLGENSPVVIGLFILFIVFALALFIPSLAAAVRRLHDTGKSGWWWVLGIIPLVSYIGSIILLVYYCTDGDRGTNKYGIDPKNPSASNEINEIGKAID